jgi:two-component system sensor histidine kinase RegB
VIYGLGNIIENATDFARAKVEIKAEWSAFELLVTIADDGPGFPDEVMDTIGEPYVTTRPNEEADDHAGLADEGYTGLGLGFFIAKTLLERSGATVTLANRSGPTSGAEVRISWPRAILLTR